MPRDVGLLPNGKVLPGKYEGGKFKIRQRHRIFTYTVLATPRRDRSDHPEKYILGDLLKVTHTR